MTRERELYDDDNCIVSRINQFRLRKTATRSSGDFVLYWCIGGAEIARPENVGPQKNNDWKLQHLENDGPNRSPGICKTWKMQDLENNGLHIAEFGDCRQNR